MDTYCSIKKVSEITGLSPSNIRYYENEGLIKHIGRDDNGIRRFSEKEIEWITFLGKLKEMEMPISQMKQYAILREQGSGTIKERMLILDQHKQCLLAKISSLYKDIDLLENKIELYKKMERYKP